MKRTLSIFEIVLTLILVAVGCVGIALSVKNGIDKGSGELTLENYTNYVDVTGSLSSMYGELHTAQGDFASTDYFVEMTTSHYVLSNVNITYDVKFTCSVNGKTENCSLTEQTTSVYTVSADRPFNSNKLAINIPIPPNTPLFDLLHVDIDMELTVTAISGTYRYDRSQEI